MPTQTVECYPAVKSKIMPFAATWMDPQIITLNEESQRKANTGWHRLYLDPTYEQTDSQTQRAHWASPRGRRVEREGPGARSWQSQTSTYARASKALLRRNTL